MILLDTSVLVELFRIKDKRSSFFFQLTKIETEFAISTITHYEIFLGSNESQDNFWRVFFNSLTILPFDISCSLEAVKIYKDLKAKNKLIELADITVASTAIANRLTLATLNKKHFERIKDLKIMERK